MINNQDLHNQIENDQIPGADYFSEYDSEDTVTQLYVGNSHLMKVICNTISKTLLYYCQDPKVFGCTGISAVNIGGSTIHFCLGV